MQEDLEKLIEVIEQQLGWGRGVEWSGHEFEALRQEILDKTGEALSVTTLKRVWGKVRQDNSPSRSTLNILAQFAGYEHWNHFRQTPEQFPASDITLPRRKSRLMPVLWVIITAILVGGTMLLYLVQTTALSEEKIDRISFEATVTSKGLPASVSFAYDLGVLPATSFSITPSDIQSQPLPILESSGKLADTYYFPGYFKVALLKDGAPVKETSLKFSTEGWQALLNRSSLNFPIYLRREQLTIDSILELKAKDFSQLDKDKDYVNFWLSNVADEPKIDGKNFSLKTTFRLQQPFENSPCKVASIIIYGTNAKLSFGFCRPGCIGALNFDLAGQPLLGQNNDLSGFGWTTEDWVRVEVSCRDQLLTISLDETLILEHTLENDLGKIGGLSFVFDGLGAIRSAVLRDIEGDWVMFSPGD